MKKNRLVKILFVVTTAVTVFAAMAFAQVADSAKKDTAQTGAPAASSGDQTAAPSRDDVRLPNADSLEYTIRNDYLLCTGDTTFISRERLFRWKNRMDSLIFTDKGYFEKFKQFVSATGIKAHEVRPCEPVVFFEQLDKQLNEMDSIVNAVRKRKERERKDSALVANALAKATKHPADIFDVPGGISKEAMNAMFRRNNIRAKSRSNILQVDSVMFDSVKVTIAFIFDDKNKFVAYEMETDAVNGEQLNTVVRPWANRLTAAYEKMLKTPPTAKYRVGFHDIKQGRMSITNKWSKGKPTVLVGLATHNNLYYAKVMVNY